MESNQTRKQFSQIICMNSDNPIGCRTKNCKYVHLPRDLEHSNQVLREVKVQNNILLKERDEFTISKARNYMKAKSIYNMKSKETIEERDSIKKKLKMSNKVIKDLRIQNKKLEEQNKGKDEHLAKEKLIKFLLKL